MTARRDARGRYPRKGVTHDMGQVTKELCDVALTALCAMAHLGVLDPMARFAYHVEFVHDRAGLTTRPSEPERGER